MHARALPGVAIIGGGPAGLMAAETLRAQGVEVDLFDRMGSVGRKFLIAGKGGLNLTHGEARPAFDARYREARPQVSRWLDVFDADALRTWARGFGIETYVGSSGRVFPEDRKAAPLLRGWVRRLRQQGVHFHMHHCWLGWRETGALRFATHEGERDFMPRATVLALGGGSWAKLGSDGAWLHTLREHGIEARDLQPANCGFDIAWSEPLRTRFAGTPLKPVIARWRDADGRTHARQGECVISEYGIEGSLIYAASADLREACRRDGFAMLALDLAPHADAAALQVRLHAHASRSTSERLRRAGIAPVHAALLREVLGAEAMRDAATVARALKSLPLRLERPRPIDEAISSAGGVRLDALDEDLMSQQCPGVFCAGEMLDWEAPTGGYLLQACFASGVVAGNAAAQWLKRNDGSLK